MQHFQLNSPQVLLKKIEHEVNQESEQLSWWMNKQSNIHKYPTPKEVDGGENKHKNKNTNNNGRQKYQKVHSSNSDTHHNDSHNHAPDIEYTTNASETDDTDTQSNLNTNLHIIRSNLNTHDNDNGNDNGNRDHSITTTTTDNTPDEYESESVSVSVSVYDSNQGHKNSFAYPTPGYNRNHNHHHSQSQSQNHTQNPNNNDNNTVPSAIVIPDQHQNNSNIHHYPRPQTQTQTQPQYHSHSQSQSPYEYQNQYENQNQQQYYRQYAYQGQEHGQRSESRQSYSQGQSHSYSSGRSQGQAYHNSNSIHVYPAPVTNNAYSNHNHNHNHNNSYGYNNQIRAQGQPPQQQPPQQQPQPQPQPMSPHVYLNPHNHRSQSPYSNNARVATPAANVIKRSNDPHSYPTPSEPNSNSRLLPASYELHIIYRKLLLSSLIIFLICLLSFIAGLFYHSSYPAFIFNVCILCHSLFGIICSLYKDRSEERQLKKLKYLLIYFMQTCVLTIAIFCIEFFFLVRFAVHYYFDIISESEHAMSDPTDSGGASKEFTIEVLAGLLFFYFIGILFWMILVSFYIDLVARACLKRGRIGWLITKFTSIPIAIPIPIPIRNIPNVHPQPRAQPPHNPVIKSSHKVHEHNGDDDVLTPGGPPHNPSAGPNPKQSVDQQNIGRKLHRMTHASDGSHGGDEFIYLKRNSNWVRIFSLIIWFRSTFRAIRRFLTTMTGIRFVGHKPVISMHDELIKGGHNAHDGGRDGGNRNDEGMGDTVTQKEHEEDRVKAILEEGGTVDINYGPKFICARCLCGWIQNGWTFMHHCFVCSSHSGSALVVSRRGVYDDEVDEFGVNDNQKSLQNNNNHLNNSSMEIQIHSQRSNNLHHVSDDDDDDMKAEEELTNASLHTDRGGSRDNNNNENRDNASKLWSVVDVNDNGSDDAQKNSRDECQCCTSNKKCWFVIRIFCVLILCYIFFPLLVLIVIIFALSLPSFCCCPQNKYMKSIWHVLCMFCGLLIWIYVWFWVLCPSPTIKGEWNWNTQCDMWSNSMFVFIQIIVKTVTTPVLQL